MCYTLKILNLTILIKIRHFKVLLPFLRRLHLNNMLKTIEKNDNSRNSTRLSVEMSNFHLPTKSSKTYVFNSFKEYALSTCREHLGGVWNDVSSEKFSIKQLTGGLTNYLYLCSLIDTEPIKNEPLQILLRIYGDSKSDSEFSTLRNVVVSTILSDKNIGPKIYGILPNGLMEQFILGNILTPEDICKKESSKQIARVLANFHALQMPFSKEPRWLFDTILKYLKQIETNIKFTNKHDIEKFNKLISYNLDHEFHELKELLEPINSPVVFCHNDFQALNIMKISNDKFIAIDYDYSCYNYRGFDIGNHFCEWMMNNSFEKYPYFAINLKQYPNKDYQLNFIRSYLNEYHQLTSDSNSNYKNKKVFEERLLVEINYFALASHFLWSVWAICKAPVMNVNFSYLDYALQRMNIYFKHKKQLIDGNIPPVLDD